MGLTVLILRFAGINSDFIAKLDLILSNRQLMPADLQIHYCILLNTENLILPMLANSQNLNMCLKIEIESVKLV